MLRRLYDWTLRLAGRRHAMPALAGVSFAESSFFPIPPDVLLVPIILARPDRAWAAAALCTIASVVGGIVGYAIGALLWDTVGAWLIGLYGLESEAASFRQSYAVWGLWIILIKGLTPIPYKLVTIVSGFAGYDLAIFMLASIATRGARFFLVAALVWRFGEPIREFIERHLTLVTTALIAVVVLGFVAARYLV